MKVKRIPSGCKSLDKILGGGFESGTLTQIFGEPGSGKTNLCLQLAVSCARSGGKVVYIDTEGFSPERFYQIAGEDAHKISKSILIYEPGSFEEQWSAIHEIERFHDIGLVLWDSATFYYRYELDDSNEVSLKRDLARMIASLLKISRKYRIPVIITNQIYTDIDHQEIKPLGGSMVEHLSKVILQLEKVSDGRRRAILRKHRSMPEGATCDFLLTEKGVEDAEA
jgi:DNA repair protein RadB